MDTAAVPQSVLDEARKPKGNPVLLPNLEHVSSAELKTILDYIINNMAARKLRLKGIRTDRGIVDKLGLTPDRLWNTDYRRIPVVVAAHVPFDSMEFDFESL